MKHFWNNNSGSMATITALIGGALLVALAMSVDFAIWQSQKSKLQDAADSGALSGAVLLGNGGRNVETHAKDQAKEFAETVNESTITGFSSDAIVDVAAETVEVNLSVNVPRIFSGYFVKQDPRLHVTSMAKVVKESVYCIYALNPTAATAIEGNGSATLQGNNCSIHVASNNPNAMSNSGTITAANITVAGGYSGTGYFPTPVTGSAVHPDPMLGVAIPSPGAICDHTNLSVNIDTTLYPGVYCGGLHVTGPGITIELEAGIYFMNDGDLKVSGGATVSGDEVVFVLSGTASVDISGNGAVLTSPPVSGPLEGFSIAQERSAPLGKVSKITGEGRFEFPGIIYMPNQALDIGGRAVGNTYTPTYAAIIANTIKVSGSGELIATANTSNFSQQASTNLSNVGARLVH